MAWISGNGNKRRRGGAEIAVCYCKFVFISFMEYIRNERYYRFTLANRLDEDGIN